MTLYALASACAVGLFFFIAEYQGLYVSARGISYSQEVLRIWWVWLGVILGLLLLAFASKISASYPRSVILTWFLVAPLMLSLWRWVFGKLLQILRSRERHRQTVVIYGAGDMGRKLGNMLLSAPWMGLKLVGYYDDQPPAQNMTEVDLPAPLCGGMDELIAAVQQEEVAVVYIAVPLGQEIMAHRLITALADTSATVYLVPNLFVSELLHARWMNVNGVPTISVFESPFYGVDGGIKRLEDLLLATFFLVLTAVPMLIIALAVKLSSPGPVIYRQRRYGLDGREIVVWKFRTMKVCDTDNTFTQVTRDDPRVTPVGRFLRRYSLDELPQLVNVLQGTMSLVGPRPHPVALNEQHRHWLRGYMLRHRVKPGITGLAQVNGWRGETETLEKMAKRLEYDLEYIRRWSLWLDLVIIVRTLFGGFKSDSAY